MARLIMSYKAFAGCLITICDCYTFYIDSNYNNNDDSSTQQHYNILNTLQNTQKRQKLSKCNWKIFKGLL